MRMAQQTEKFFPQFEGKKSHNLSSGSHDEILSRSEVLLGIPSLQLVGPILIRPGFVSGHGPVQSLQVTLSTPYYDASNPL